MMLTITTNQTSTEKVEEMLTLTIAASKFSQKGDNLQLLIYDLVIFSFQILRNTLILNHCVFKIHSQGPLRKGAQQQSAADARRYRLLDEPKG